jgi:ADP-heptose:LPS heptosyltransferase
MGDVLLTLPVMRSVLREQPDLSILFVTRKKFAPYFRGIERLEVIPFDPEGDHRGISGLFRLFRELRRRTFGAVIDLHSILRTWILGGLLFASGHPVYRVSKHRRVRRKVLSRSVAGLAVRHTVLRYSDVFLKAGIRSSVDGPVFEGAGRAPATGVAVEPRLRIGIAPVSKHQTKNWGLNRTAELIELILNDIHAEIFLFGGKEDQHDLDIICGPDVHNQAGRTDLTTELELICSLDLFVSMDSANMHLAALAGVPVVSIWGATDPSLGFAPLNQPETNSIYADPERVTCRPCSVYGEIPCHRTDSPMLCMTSISPERVLAKIKEILQPAGKI